MIDFEAAFDTIPPATVILQCIKLGISGKMLKFTVDYLENRCIEVAENGVVSTNYSVVNGIPQGGIICPTLFNIALHDLSKDLPPDVGSCTFADDFTIWATNDDPMKATVSIQQALHILTKWCQKWSLKMSVDKTECTFLTRRNNLVNFRPQLSILNKALKYNQNPKLLGVVLDPKLRWAKHVESVVEKCNSRLNALKAVASRNWGADTSTLRMFYLTFVRAKATYCCEVWGAAAKTHIDKIQKIQSAALRICLGCPKTTPISAMEVELGIEPVEIFIARQTWLKSLKIRSASLDHPLRLVVARAGGIKNSFTYQVDAMASSFSGNGPESVPVCYDESPRAWPEVCVVLDLPSKVTKQQHVEFLRAETLQMINEKYGNHVRIFTDGSVDLENGNSGAGYYNETTGDCYYVPANSQSSMDAELLALNAALVSCWRMEEVNFCILTDSKSALQVLSNPETTAYSFRIAEIRNILIKLHANGKSVTLQWVPSHCGVNGNETADSIAKAASQMYPTDNKIYSLSYCKSEADRYFRIVWKEKWVNASVGRYLFKIQPEPAEEDIYKGLPRQIASFVARARTGHIVTEKYLFRFNLAASPRCALCEEDDEDLEHILIKCSYPILARDILRAEVGDIEEILKQRKFWLLAHNAYNGHRAIGYT